MWSGLGWKLASENDHLAGDLPVTDFLVLIPGVAAGPGTYLTDMETELSIFRHQLSPEEDCDEKIAKEKEQR